MGTACFAYGSKHVLASEASLLMMTTVVLGPVSVWMALSEFPGHLALLGGGLLLVVLLSHERSGLLIQRHLKRKSSEPNFETTNRNQNVSVEETGNTEIVV